MKKQLMIPKFKNETTERSFWENLDLSDYFEPSDFQPATFPNLKPVSRPISIRLPEHLIDRIKEEANRINVPYQTLIKKTLSTTFLSK